ncbi:DUF2079 domain-containing protein [Patescibacteria group bacterium]
MIKIIRKNFWLICLGLYSLLILLVNIRINTFRYHNFDYGKFDLGNMTQMVWNVTQGNGLMLTDYFGTNLPRWAMSHVDPILYLFVPLFAVFPHALTLVYSQLILVIFSSILIYKIAELHLKSRFAAFLLGISYLVYPAIGFLIAWTGFHGVTAVIPFFLGAFYVFEKMYKDRNFTKGGITAFWVLTVLTMMGKEQLPLYIFFCGIFIFLFRNYEAKSFSELFKTKIGRLGLWVVGISALWFFMAFFVIIPLNAHYRVEGYQKFVQSIKLDDSVARDVALPNYFLSRYDEFGDSYLEIAANMLIRPKKTAEVFFGGDKLDNLNRTFMPLVYLPLAYPSFFILAVPDLAINYLTTAGGIGTAEISNHRISMIVPILFISTILGIRYLSAQFKKWKLRKTAIIILATLVLGTNVYTSFKFNNPVYLWLSQAIKKRVFAKSTEELIGKELELGEVIRLSELEGKDRECAIKIVNLVPPEASVSGPDSLGTHLAQRETYAIFPALYNEADYVIVDVFARKILTILDIDVEMVQGFIEDLIKDENYALKLGCGNYFVFQRVGPHEKEPLLPMQQRFEYDRKVNYEFFQGVTVVDFEVEEVVQRGNLSRLMVVYDRVGAGGNKNTTLEEYLMFTSFVHKETGEIYQMANLPSHAITRPEDWEKSRFYIENVEFVLPEFVDAGEYMVFVGMDNKSRTRSIYLGDVIVE